MKTITLIIGALIVATIFFSGCNEISDSWGEDEEEWDAEKGGLTYLLSDRIAQSVELEHQLIDEIKFTFREASGQTVRLTTEQTYGGNKPSSSPIIYDDITVTLPESGTDVEVIFEGFGSSYSYPYNWLQLWLVSGPALDIYCAEVQYVNGFAVINTGWGWSMLADDIAFDINFVGDKPDVMPGELIELTFNSNADVEADLHDVSEEVDTLSFYLGGARYLLWRITGTFNSDGWMGQHQLLFFMGYGDLHWIREDLCSFKKPWSVDKWLVDWHDDFRTKGTYFKVWITGGKSLEGYGTIYLEVLP
jgi:hypothetical protein